MDGLFSFGGWEVWLLAALAFLCIELATGTMVSLSISIALAVSAAYGWAFGSDILIQLGLATALSIVLTIVLRRVFGNWGSVSAATDPNDYVAESHLTRSGSTKPESEI